MLNEASVSQKEEKEKRSYQRNEVSMQFHPRVLLAGLMITQPRTQETWERQAAHERGKSSEAEREREAQK